MLDDHPVGGEFIITLRLASGTDRGNGAAKRSDQGLAFTPPQIVLDPIAAIK
jgi:hypothetical protein